METQKIVSLLNSSNIQNLQQENGTLSNVNQNVAIRITIQESF